jgi:prepilin-type N-terminal cleavage/methylation domain-containing protein
MAGFSLIEVLVALAISVMVVSIGLPAVSDSLSRQSDARLRMSAVGLAHSKLEEFMALTERDDLPRSGIMNGLHWRVSVSDGSPADKSGSTASLMMERIGVEVRRDPGTSPMISLTALHLKRVKSL